MNGVITPLDLKILGKGSKSSNHFSPHRKHEFRAFLDALKAIPDHILQRSNKETEQ